MHISPSTIYFYPIIYVLWTDLPFHLPLNPLNDWKESIESLDVNVDTFIDHLQVFLNDYYYQGYTTCLLVIGLWRNNGLVEGGVVVVEEDLEVIYESVNVYV